MPLFSVIIPTYQRAHLIARALDSVFAQELDDQEVIVVDDGSTDNTDAVLRRYEPRIRLIRQANKGPGAARNAGARVATGKYIAFLDSDDLWFPWTLASYARIIADHAEPSIIAGQILSFADEAQLRSVAPAPLKIERFADYFASSHHNRYCGSGQMCVRRDLLLASGGFSERLIVAEDVDLVMRLGTAPGFVWVLSPAMIAYRQHPQSVTQRYVHSGYEGKIHLVHQEREGRYPGGETRRRERMRILAMHIRPASLALLQPGQFGRAWDLYRQTLVWQLGLGRFKYLAAFPVAAALKWARF